MNAADNDIDWRRFIQVRIETLSERKWYTPKELKSKVKDQDHQYYWDRENKNCQRVENIRRWGAQMNAAGWIGTLLGHGKQNNRTDVHLQLVLIERIKPKGKGSRQIHVPDRVKRSPSGLYTGSPTHISLPLSFSLLAQGSDNSHATTQQRNTGTPFYMTWLGCVIKPSYQWYTWEPCFPSNRLTKGSRESSLVCFFSTFSYSL